jgi:urease accessory protein UreH
MAMLNNQMIYGMSSFPLTNSIIFQDGRYTTNQDIVLSKTAPFVSSNWLNPHYTH